MSEMDPEAPQVDYDEMSRQVMYELLGRRFVWPRLRAIDVYPSSYELVLTGRPVSEVESVTILPSGKVLAEDDYEIYSKFRIRIKRHVRLPGVGRPRHAYGVYPGGAFCADGINEIQVQYVYGSPPPLHVSQAIDTLSCELALAAEGSKECRLPKRVQSIVRQGISMTILDPQDFLDKGRTGLTEVDFALSIYNSSRAKARARVFTDRHPPARRLSVTRADVEEP